MINYNPNFSKKKKKIGIFKHDFYKFVKNGCIKSPFYVNPLIFLWEDYIYMYLRIDRYLWQCVVIHQTQNELR